MFWLKRTTGLLVIAAFFALAATQISSQEPAKPQPSPSPTPDTVKVFTEEVRLPVVAFDSYGHYDPTLELDDILVLEDGVAQQLRSVRHIPANVLFILDCNNSNEARVEGPAINGIARGTRKGSSASMSDATRSLGKTIRNAIRKRTMPPAMLIVSS